MNTLPSERVAIAATINPDATTVGTHTTVVYAEMAKFKSVLATILCGVLGTAATVDMKLVQATDIVGTGKKDIAGKAITTLTKAANDNDQAVINCRDEELDVNNGFGYIGLEITVSGATSDLGALLQGFDPRYAPASDHNISTVVEVVN